MYTRRNKDLPPQRKLAPKREESQREPGDILWSIKFLRHLHLIPQELPPWVFRYGEFLRCDFYFLIKPHDPEEVASALREYHRKNQHRLQGGKIWTWKTDNGGEFRGEAIDGIGGIGGIAGE